MTHFSSLFTNKKAEVFLLQLLYIEYYVISVKTYSPRFAPICLSIDLRSCGLV